MTDATENDGMTHASASPEQQEFGRSWRRPLAHLADRMRTAARSALNEALQQPELSDFATPTGRGVGDWTFALDDGPEAVLSEWLEECAREAPLSLLTEDAGWRHRGPGPRAGTTVELDGFDHGGARIAVDPVDGTRNLMFDLRPAWSVLSFAGPGPNEPRFADLSAGMVSEIPASGARSYRRLWAVRGAGCERERYELSDDASAGVAAPDNCVHSGQALHVDADDRPDNGYFSFFTYDSQLRPTVARVAASFFARLEKHEGAQLSSCYDDQYISSGGQLALLSQGSYRFVADLRSTTGEWHGRSTQVAKPYDMAGAALCAMEAGAIVESVDGSALDIPIDATTPVDFIAFANPATRARLRPHFDASLVEIAESF
ncbi:MAG: hypothetical protein ACI841_000219 [Planctomycetota bacterium]